MSFVPRTYTSIIVDMIAYVQDYTELTDFSVGSVVRTFLEAAALEDDEQYFQMVQLLDIFSYTTAAGEDLDRRLADFNIFRSPSKDAFGEVMFFNGNLVYDIAAADTFPTGVPPYTVQIFDSTGFPTFPTTPYTIRIGERTVRAQDALVIALDTSSNTFTLNEDISSEVLVGDRVSLVTGSVSSTIGAGVGVQAPATVSENSKAYNITETSTISAGNYYSNQVLAISTTSGPSGNVGAERITQFVGSPPFSGAGVTNLVAFSGGTSRESDSDFRARAVEKLQSLSRGTVLAIKSGSVGITDSATGQRVISSNVLEDFAADPEEVIVYIDDGTGLVPDVVALAQSALTVAVTIPVSVLSLTDASSFPSSGFVLVEDRFLAEYSAISGNDLLLVSPTSDTDLASLPSIVRFVDVVSASTEEGQRRFNLQKPPIVRSSSRIYIQDPSSETWELLDDGTGYVLNKGTGEFSLVGPLGLVEGSQVAASYNYYTNLVAETQKVLEGDVNDSVNYPGIKAAGIFLSVEAPTFKRITVRVTISAEVGFVESELAPLVKQEIETYINSLKIGEDVIISRIIDVSHNVTGVLSVNLQLPTSDLVVLENELPVTFDSSKNSLVTVL